jgi:exodeoxyribonuclease V gamma subunit
LADLPIDIKIKGYRLVGKLENRYENGSLFYRYADLKGKDFICAWLHHLIINQVQEQTTFLLSTDEDLILLPDYCQPNLLSAFMNIYRAGNKSPDAFFVEAALAYVKQAYKLKNGNQASKSALDAAKEQLSRADPPTLRARTQTAISKRDRPLEAVLGETFEQHCQILLQPIWNATHQ